ncbi:hypothetical protein BCR36DRAFT_131615 [Piromyces finnis]|uniref:Uncharacterized protein n=1 Tax=Piromyces finnis TaxID=1754191 RepID=A0A1Y1UZ76_9FUNG|nr:hypothetical protein BCR36DRAFT_131615 [Piromyces finnis]|eukprot:ORX43904.1 hypothetical protein BCR36DRAFT_131615 [Piromyces finnis]
MDIKLNVSNNPLLNTGDNDSSLVTIIIIAICIIILIIVIVLIYLKTKKKIYENGNRNSTMPSNLKNVQISNCTGR